MCGIFGELGPSPEGGMLRDRWATQATAALRHRGPDGHGRWSDAHALLGHLRLAILDLSERASQPMASASGRSIVAFNGEIYNFAELRARMPAPPGGFHSTGDTEVLAELLDARGLDALGDLVGMFAFACYRPASRELWLARDRLGKKPLYYARTRAGALRFASEVAGLLADDLVPRRTSPALLAEFLQHGYVAAPRSSFLDVAQLEPGTVLVARLGPDGRLETSTRRYWDLPRARPAHRRREEWDEEFAHVLRDAVKIRLRSDVPLGAFLSGGVDSSVVTRLAAEEAGAPLRTFTVDFDESAFSEAAHAREVAAAVGTVHSVLTLRPEDGAGLDELVGVYGDLHGDSSALPTLALCAATRREVTVALSGDGGDELLGGYGRYASTLADVRRVARVPRSIARLTRAVAAKAPVWIRGPSRLGRLSGDLGTYYALEVRSYSPRDWPTVLRAELRAPWDDAVASALAEEASRAPLQRLMATDVRTYLPGDVLVKVDRASMAHGLEVRSPLLDHRLFELTMVAEPSWLADGAGTKGPLRRLFASSLPPAVFSRKKMGFGVPLRHWLRAELAELARARLLRSGSRLAALVDQAELRRVLFAHARRLRDESTRIWHLLLLDAWLDRFGVEVVSR